MHRAPTNAVELPLEPISNCLPILDALDALRRTEYTGRVKLCLERAQARQVGAKVFSKVGDLWAVEGKSAWLAAI